MVSRWLILPRRLEAEASDVMAIARVVGNTRVVIGAAGPFSRYGTAIVAACVEFGTHYVDITGEVEHCHLWLSLSSQLTRPLCFTDALGTAGLFSTSIIILPHIVICFVCHFLVS